MFLIIEHRVLACRIIFKIHPRTDFHMLAPPAFSAKEWPFAVFQADGLAGAVNRDGSKGGDSSSHVAMSCRMMGD